MRTYSPPNAHLNFRGTGIRNVLELGRHEYTSAGRHLWPHVHDSRRLEICYLARGRKAYLINEKPVVLSGGDVHVIFPGDSHSAGDIPEEAGILYYLCLSLRKNQSSFMNLRGPGARTLVSSLLNLAPRMFKGSPRLQEHLDAAIDSLQQLSTDPLAAVRACNYIEGFLLEVVSCAAHTRRRAMPPRFRQLLRNIDRHLTTPPTTGEMARSVGLSLSRFKAVFSREVGIPPADYVLRRRIDLAKERLLLDRRRSITDVALDLSFSSSQYFSTVFKRYTGMTPSEFRKRPRRPRRLRPGT